MEYKEESSCENDKTTQRNESLEQQKLVLSYLHDLIFALIAVLLVAVLIFRIVVVNGPSMRETLESGDCLIVLSNVFYKEPKQGDIIVASKNTFRNGEPIIKRIIATENQEVDIDFDNGIVYVDGVALDEPYIKAPTTLYEGISFPIVVEKGCVFVMGDNRNDSKDSRSPEIGLIDCREIIGKAIFLVFPGENEETEQRYFNRIGVLH